MAATSKKRKASAHGIDLGIAATKKLRTSSSAPSPTDQVKSESRSLLDLPAELRVQIYGYLFASLKPKTCYRQRYPGPEISFAVTFPGFVRTSRSLRNEAVPQYRQHLEYIRWEYVWRTRALRIRVADIKKDREWIDMDAGEYQRLTKELELTVAETKAEQVKVDRVDELLLALANPVEEDG